VRVCAAPDCHNGLTGRSDMRYCSDRCKKRHHRLQSPADPGENSRDKAPGPPVPDKTNAFQRLQGDAVLSNWTPHATLETDIPDIPNFLRRPLSPPQECTGCGRTFQPTTYGQSRCSPCQPLPDWYKARPSQRARGLPERVAEGVG
jgi:hypothetical protein